MRGTVSKRVRINISLLPETRERLVRCARERHRSVSQAVTDLVWRERLDGEGFRYGNPPGAAPQTAPAPAPGPLEAPPAPPVPPHEERYVNGQRQGRGLKIFERAPRPNGW